MKKIKKTYNRVVDEIELAMSEMPAVHSPVRHIFSPGLYAREVTIPAGTLLTSKVHNSEHIYIISKGSVSVIKEDNGQEELKAPFTGTTLPGTRRVVYTHEETVWTTFHPTDIVPGSDSLQDIEAAVARIEDIIIEKHENKLLTNNEKEELN